MEPIQLTDAPIHFILTGGTVDSRYAPDKCTVVPRQHSGIPEYLTEVVGLGKEEIRFTEVCMKDSRDLTDKEVDKIKTTIENSSSDHFIISHGTYTLSKTAMYLTTHLKRKDVTVILTGSMIPLNNFYPTDAGFNLGFALAQCINSSPGVFVCIFGKKMLPDQVPNLHT